MPTQSWCLNIGYLLSYHILSLYESRKSRYVTFIEPFHDRSLHYCCSVLHCGKQHVLRICTHNINDGLHNNDSEIVGEHCCFELKIRIKRVNVIHHFDLIGKNACLGIKMKISRIMYLYRINHITNNVLTIPLIFQSPYGLASPGGLPHQQTIYQFKSSSGWPPSNPLHYPTN